MLRKIQAAFRAGVLDGADDAIGEHVVSDRIAADRRLAIYRSNTFISLTIALEAAFPVVRRLVGERFFAGTARAFITAHPPEVPQLLSYGGRFAGFLEGFSPARDLPYLAHVARLEWARNEAYFAGEEAAVDAAALKAIPPDRYPRLRLRPHLATRLTSSPYPIQTIWAVNQVPEGEPVARVDLGQGAERVLVHRRPQGVQAALLSPGEYALLRTFAAGASLEEAAGQALAAEPGLDLQAALLSNLVRGTFGGWELED